jgi:uncharacterized repeat protein (TIGR01451 family)/gliding motility-associated-like protein
MKKLILFGLFICSQIMVRAQAPTYINGPTTIFAASTTVWYGDVMFGPNAIVTIEDGAAPVFYGKNMTVDPAATFISLPGNNQTGTGKIIFRDNNPLYPSYPLQQTLNGGFSTGANPSLLNIEIDNALGLSITGNTRVTNAVLFTRGHIYLNNFNLVLDNDATFNSFDVSKHVVTNGTGVIVKEALANGGSFLFPVSIAGTDYTPATVRNNAAARNINVQVKNYSSSVAVETAFSTKGMDRTWQISSDIAGSANVSLQHNTLNNTNGARTDESAFTNTAAYVTQQMAPGSWSSSFVGSNGGSPVSTHIGNNLNLPNTVNATAYFTKQSVSYVDLFVNKTVNNAVPTVGSNLTFTIKVVNLGVADATGVLVSDLLPSGYTYVSSTTSVGTYNSATGLWNIGGLGYGASETLTVVATVNASGNYANTAVVGGIELDPDASNNSSTVTPVPGVIQANLKVEKSANNTSPTIGNNVVFTITASNLGPNAATGVSVTDLLSAGYAYVSSTVSVGSYNSTTGIWTIGNLANGANATLSITAKVNASGTYGNTATIKGNELDPVTGNNTSTVTPVPVQPTIQANLEVQKTVNIAAPVVGANVVFTILASNLGPGNATGVKVTDLLPVGYTFVSSTVTIGTFNSNNGLWSVGNLAIGTSATLTITASVNALGPYANTATITGNESDPDLTNNTSTVTPAPTTGSVNVSIQKTATNASISLGNTFDYTIVVKNIGTLGATQVTATDILPDGITYVSSTVASGTANYAAATRTLTWNIGNLAVGTTTTLTLKVTADKVGKIVNTATATVKEIEALITDNTSTVSNEILGLNIPNVITPNGDGKNDTFFIDGLDAYAESNLIIFNRWNNEVYNSHGNYKNNWAGQALNDGTYYYLLKIKNKAGVSQALTGHITLLRKN